MKSYRFCKMAWSPLYFFWTILFAFGIQAEPLSVLHVVDNPEALSPADSMVQARLSALGLVSILAEDDTVSTENASSMQCIIIEESCTSSKVENKFKNVAVPVISMEPFAWDMDCYVDTTNGLSFGWTPGPSDFTLEVNDLHPISGPWQIGDDVIYYSGSDTTANKLNWGIPAGEGVSVLNVPETDESVLFAYETGALMANNFIAPDKRIAFYLQKNVADSLSDDGWLFLYTSLDWCLSSRRTEDTTRIALFTEDTDWRMNGGELLVWQRFLNQGFDVSSSAAATFFSSNWEDYDCAVIQSSCPADQVPSQYMAAVPILNSQAYAYSINSPWILESDLDIIPVGTDEISIDLPEHPVALGASGPLQIASQPISLNCVQNPAGSPEIIASANGYAALFCYEIESPLLQTYRLDHRYIGFPVNSEELKVATPSLWDIWDASVQWLLSPGQSAVSERVQSMPEQPVLYPPFPNPFNASTRLTFHLPSRMEIQINLYDATGRHVCRLRQGTVEAGLHFVDIDARDLSSGMYLCSMTGPSQAAIQKVVLIQ